jgi:hypothetical protein
LEDGNGLEYVSTRTVHEWTRRRIVPFRRLPHSRALLFLEEKLLAFESGAELRVVERGGGIYVTPR